MSDFDVLHELSATIDALGPQERDVLLILAKRILMGQNSYGLLDVHCGKDWKKERAAEVADLLVYSAFEELKAARK